MSPTVDMWRTSPGWAWRPDVFDAFFRLRSLLNEQAGLSLRERSILVCATAASVRDSHCALVWGTTLASEDEEIFDATVFVAFRLAFSTVNDALGARPDLQLAAAGRRRSGTP
jgi:alkylhydroperoxidase/carboxymuconolactone decarboxylase family protein YurZ